MEALCESLGRPERTFRSLHVVGTNGKTSVTVLCAALLEASGIRAGACVSPHVSSWRERTLLDGEPIGERDFERAVTEVGVAVEGLGEASGEAQPVTQFEAAVAASFVAFRDAGVEVAVIEAGLGGRLDATNVITSEAAALTSVALDHTDWLGGTVEQIAAEKLAVLEPGTTLVLGRLEPGIDRLAGAHAERLGASVVRAPELPAPPAPPDWAPYLRRDAGVARALAATIAPPLTDPEVRGALAGLRLAGRLEWIGGDPPILADAAHNAEGATALAEALEAEPVARPRVGCVSILADKDAASFARTLAPSLDRVVTTAADPGPAMGRPGARAADPGPLAERFRSAGVEAAVEPDPVAAIEAARAAARELGGVAICAGSNYLLRYLWTGKRDRSCSR